MFVPHIKKYCPLGLASQDLLKQALNNLNLTARGYHRIIKVARTIADLEKKEDIETCHIAEAIQYRLK